MSDQNNFRIAITGNLPGYIDFCKKKPGISLWEKFQLLFVRGKWDDNCETELFSKYLKGRLYILKERKKDHGPK